jgi:lipoprotein-anchoring transpeptidase ErfK/SrfK
MNSAKGDKTMRRHVENPVENQERENFSILLFFAMWVLALLALSSAARAEEKQATVSADIPAQPIVTTNNKAQVTPSQQADRAAAPKTHQLKTTASASQKQSEVSDPAQQPQAENVVTLSRFILISIPDRQLALIDGGQIVKIYPIAVGTDGTPSPEGDFTIISRVTNPSWTHKGKVVGPGKGNPVGSRWMGLSLKGYGIHGTNAPRSIGRAASHGCFRMGKKDVEQLFTLVRVGDVVAVRSERDGLMAQVFGGSNNGDAPVVAAAATTADSGQ